MGVEGGQGGHDKKAENPQSPEAIIAFINGLSPVARAEYFSTLPQAALEMLRNAAGQGGQAKSRRFTFRLPYQRPLPDHFNTDVQVALGEQRLSVDIAEIIKEARSSTMGTIGEDGAEGMEVLRSLLIIEQAEDFVDGCGIIRDTLVAENGVVPVMLRSAEDLVARTGGDLDKLEADRVRGLVLPILETVVTHGMQGYFRERLAERHAYIDPKTGFPTAAFTNIYIQRLMQQEIPTALVTFDMKGLGVYNTALTEPITDKLLEEIFTRLRHISSRESDVSSIPRYRESVRLGAVTEKADGTNGETHKRGDRGDEGQIVFPGVQSVEDLSVVMRKVYDTMSRPFEITLSRDECLAIFANKAYLEGEAEALKAEGKPLDDKLRGALEILPEIIAKIITAQTPRSRRLRPGGTRISHPPNPKKDATISFDIGLRFAATILDPQTTPEDKEFNPGPIYQALAGWEAMAKAIEKQGVAASDLVENLYILDDDGKPRNPAVLCMADGKRYLMCGNSSQGFIQFNDDDGANGVADEALEVAEGLQEDERRRREDAERQQPLFEVDLADDPRQQKDSRKKKRSS